MRLPKTTGAERLPIGIRHARFSPEGDHFDGRFVSVERPSRDGPRHSGQSAAPVTAMAPATKAAAKPARRRMDGKSAGYMSGLRNPFTGRLRHGLLRILPANAWKRPDFASNDGAGQRIHGYCARVDKEDLVVIYCHLSYRTGVTTD